MRRRLRKLVCAACLLAAAPMARAQTPMPPRALDEALAFTDFMVAGRLDPATRAKVAAILQDEYVHNPAAAEVAAHVHQALATVQADPDGVSRGVMRERGWLHNAQVLAETHNPWLQQEIAALQSAPSVIGNEGGRLVTLAEIAAQFAANDAIAKLAGLPPFSPAAMTGYAADLRSRFAALPEAERQQLVEAAGRWAALKRMLADPRMRAGVLTDISAHVHGPADVPPMARAQEDVALRYRAETGREAALARRQTNAAVFYNGAINAFTAH